jgi:type I site-specific restriction endonuclease
LSFNANVMSDERIVAFIADRIGSRLDVLGKTIIFTPNIATANRLAARIYDKFPSLRGRMAAVHSKMAEIHVPGQEEATVQDVLREFREQGSQPSLLINVDMLTEGSMIPRFKRSYWPGLRCRPIDSGRDRPRRPRPRLWGHQ